MLNSTKTALSLALFLATGLQTSCKSTAEALETTIAVPRDAEWWQARHKGMNAAEGDEAVRIVFVGDSITQGWEAKGKEVWAEQFAPLGSRNLGISGDRTQHVIWRLQNGNLDGIRPELAVVMIGTNNSGANSSKEIAAGVEEVVDELGERCPGVQVLLLAIFPRGTGLTDAMRVVNAGANMLLRAMDDGRTVHYLDINSVFLEADGTLPKSVMPDLLHPNAEGYRRWASAIRPTIDQLLLP